ncbi:tail fiber domain-containing protein [Escherichia coli]|uniref:tail fiber domain-containing protein n=1 Tax=Escherichia coli TaxID=562 RepID=UPI00201AF2C9|nr:tail fiber domain-containing protein [Escherichia coli]
MIYTIGNIAVSGNTLTGTGTNFKAPLSMIRVGCTVIVKSDPIQIFSITEIVSETELSVTPAASPDIPAGTAYSILLCDSISVDGLAQDVAETLRFYQEKEDEISSAIDGSNIGLGPEQRDCIDISGNPSSYVGFLRIKETAKGFPSVASGESSLSGFICQRDTSPSYTGVFVGWSTRSLYTYTWVATSGANWTRHARKNEVDRLVQRTGETRVCSQNANKFLTIYDSGSWGYYDLEASKWLPLPILAGGTGATSLDNAKTNLQIPEGGLSKTMTINAPSGAEDGKYYPIIVFTGDTNGSGSFPCPVEIVTNGGNAASEMNSNTFSGYVRCGGWSDIKNIAYGYYVAYEPTEVAILCVKASAKDYAQHIAFYVSSKAFPIKIQVGYKAKVTVPTSDYSLGTNGVKFKFGVSTSEEGNKENNVTNILDFTGGGSGFYSNAIFRQGYSTNFALTNKLSSSDPFIVTLPSFTVLGEINCTKGFIAYGEDVTNRTIISRRTNAASNQTLDQSEFRAAEKAAQIVVRDMTGLNHMFFNFNGDGTFNAPGGMVTHTGADWNGHQSDNVNKFKPLAGSVNGPDGTMVVGGFHAQFSGNYATQFAGRNSNFWVRSIENGAKKEWLKLLTSSFGANTPVDARDCFISDGDANPTWVPTYGAGFQSCYATSRIAQAWIGADGKMYYRFLLSDNPLTSVSDSAWHRLAAVDTENTWTNTNKFYGHYIVDSSYARFIRHIPYASTTANAHIVTWGSSSTPLNYEVKAVDTSSSESPLKTLFMAKYFSDGSASLAVEGTVTCTSVTQSSDRDLKDNIQVIGDATEAIRKMNGYTYTLKENGLPYAGVIAQEVMEALPEAVGSFTHYGEALQGPTIDGNELREETRYLNVDYAAVTGLLVQVARETDNRVTELEEENASLRANIAVMDERITKLETLVQQLTGSEE